MSTKLYWLSFADADRPKGQQFLGVAIVEIDEEDIAAAAVEVTLLWGPRPVEAHEIAAATRKAHVLGINPGGSVAASDVSSIAAHIAAEARDRLLSKAELVALGLLEGTD